MIQNLSQLKKALTKGAEFEVTEHCCPELIGEQRRVNYADTTGIYTIIPGAPDSKASKANGGKGSYLRWSKAPFWDFREDGVCALYTSDKVKTSENIVVAIQLVETRSDDK